MLVRGLWGIQIGPQSDQIIKVEASFRITMASIFEFNGPERTSVYVRFQDSTFLLCSLIPEKIEQQVVDITCLQGEEITIRVDGPNVIHLLGNYISQDGIDDQQDDEIGYLELDGSDVDNEPIDVKVEETTPSITYPAERHQGHGFDESDEFDSISEAESEQESHVDSDQESKSGSESMPFYNMTQLSAYADRLPSSSPSVDTSKDVESRESSVMNTEGTGKYVLINGNVNVRSSTEETEPLDQQSDISVAVVNHTSITDAQQRGIETEKQDKDANMDNQATTQGVIQVVESSPEHESDHESKLESEQASEQVSDYEPELESNQVSEEEEEPEQVETERGSKQESHQEPAPQLQKEAQPEQKNETQQEQEQEQEHEAQQEPQKVAEQVSKPELTSKPAVEPTLLPTPESTQQPVEQPTQQITPQPTTKPDQSTKVDKTSATSKKPKKSKKKSDAIPITTPSPIKKKADKAAKKQEKKLKAALAKQQASKADSSSSSKDANKQKKAQEIKEKNKIKAKKISKKKQALANKNEANAQNKSTTGGPSQDIGSMLMGAFANMAAAIQSAATSKPKPKSSSAPKLKKIKVEEINQDVIPPVVASSAVKPKKTRKPKAPTAPEVSQNDQTQTPIANDLDRVPSTHPKKKKKPAKKPNVTHEDVSTAAAAPVVSQNDQTQTSDVKDSVTVPSTQSKKKKPSKKPNVTQDDASTAAAAPPVANDPPAATPVPIGIPAVSPAVSPVPISVPSSARSSPAPGDRVRYPRKAVDNDSMQKLALFAQEDAKSADDVRKERKKKKKSQKSDETVAKKPRLSIE